MFLYFMYGCPTAILEATYELHILELQAFLLPCILLFSALVNLFTLHPVNSVRGQMDNLIKFAFTANAPVS